MPDDGDFTDLIRRVRSGDEQAATELVRRYEPAIRRAVRLRLVDARLGRLLDSMDICQSVMASFFVRAALGQYEVDKPEQLLRLLATIARNKLADQARKRRLEHAERGTRAEDPDVDQLAGGVPSPSRQVAAQDLLAQVRAQLSEDERQLADRRALGQEWADIAAELGGSPEALRKKLSRAVDRVAQQLGLDE
jgi:RNA polymerase sigma factor (sigma-70 family)